MRAALVALLISSVALGWGNQGGGLTTCPSGFSGGGLTPCVPYAAFELAPASGAGMTTECACAPISGARGETVTFARASTAYCTLGNQLSGLSTSSMVLCAANQPRVMTGGTSVRGLLMERALSNTVLRSQELDNASWTKTETNATVTTTADAALAPDGTMTADRVVFGATTASDQATKDQAAACSTTASVRTSSVFIKGNGTSGTLDICHLTAAATYVCAACTYVAGSYTRCSNGNVTQTTAGGTLLIGNASLINGGTVRGAADVFLWGAQCQSTNGGVLSYVATTSAAAANALENTTITLPSAIGPSFSMAASGFWTTTGMTAVAQGIFRLGASGADDAFITRSGDGTTANFTIAASATTPAASVTGGAIHRFALFDNAGTRGALFDGAVVTAPSASMSNSETALILGASSTGSFTQAQGIISQFCIDPDPTRCR